MAKKDSILGVVSIAFGAWVYYIASTLKKKAAFWPKIVAAGIIILGVIILVNALLELRRQASGKQQAPAKKEKTAKPQYIKVAAIVAILFIYYFMFQYFSYTIATALLIFSTSVVLGYRNWKVLIPTSVIVSVVLYTAFTYLFNIHFPGIFF